MSPASLTKHTLVEDQTSILIVEDDVRLATLMRDYLTQQGFKVSTEERGDHAVARISNEVPDLIILDLMLPGMDGFEICRAIRPDFSGIIMMLTAQDEDVEQIVGLELGADDYVTKPVEPRVLLARIRSLLRRAQAAGVASDKTPDELVTKRLRVYPKSRTVLVNGSPVTMTTGEFDLLWYLASRAGQIVSRDELYRGLTGIDYDGVDRSIDIRMSRLRKLLGDNANGDAQMIKTIRGKGYLLSVGADGE